MSRRLPLYVEKAIGEFQATRGFTATEFERGFRADNGVTCKPGCANCCSHPLLVTIVEGLILYRFLAGRGRLTGTLRAKLQEHSDLTNFMDPAIWMRANIPCPLLDDKQRCGGYEVRPLACRLKFSAGDPDACHPHTFDPSDMGEVRAISPVVSAFEERLLRTHGVSTIRMPLSRALLLAGEVLAGKIDLAGIARLLYEEYVAP